MPYPFVERYFKIRDAEFIKKMENDKGANCFGKQQPFSVSIPITVIVGYMNLKTARYLRYPFIFKKHIILTYGRS